MDIIRATKETDTTKEKDIRETVIRGETEETATTTTTAVMDIGARGTKCRVDTETDVIRKNT